MNYKFYKTEKIKSGRSRCPRREVAILGGNPKYVDAQGVERWTLSGNRTDTKRRWEEDKRRSLGIQPPAPKAPPEVISAKNVANVARWREANPDKLSVQRAKGNFVRRSAVRGRVLEAIGGVFLAEQRTAQNNCCAYCGTFLFDGGHQDHVIPVARGGAHIRKNIVWACEPCNLRKGAKLGWVPFWGSK